MSNKEIIHLYRFVVDCWRVYNGMDKDLANRQVEQYPVFVIADSFPDAIIKLEEQTSHKKEDISQVELVDNQLFVVKSEDKNVYSVKWQDMRGETLWAYLVAPNIVEAYEAAEKEYNLSEYCQVKITRCLGKLVI